VPLRFIVETADDLIRLRCTRRELSEMRALVLTEFIQAEMPDVVEYGADEYISKKRQCTSSLTRTALRHCRLSRCGESGRRSSPWPNIGRQSHALPSGAPEF
jgi:hypothetical protein